MVPPVKGGDSEVMGVRLRKLELVRLIAELKSGELFIKLRRRRVIGVSRDSGGNYRVSAYIADLRNPVYKLTMLGTLEGCSLGHLLECLEEEGYRPFTLIQSDYVIIFVRSQQQPK